MAEIMRVGVTELNWVREAPDAAIRRGVDAAVCVHARGPEGDVYLYLGHLALRQLAETLSQWDRALSEEGSCGKTP